MSPADALPHVERAVRRLLEREVGGAPGRIDTLRAVQGRFDVEYLNALAVQREGAVRHWLHGLEHAALCEAERWLARVASSDTRTAGGGPMKTSR